MWYDLDTNGEPVPLDGFPTFTPSDRFHLQTKIDNALVSTVFMGLDHNHISGGLPILFETIVFEPNGKYDHIQKRYCTIEEARKGHNYIISNLKFTNLTELLKKI
jgi:hypothetical protein